MLRSCMPDFAQLSRLISSYFVTHSSSEVPSQQVCDLSSIPYTTWKPPTCPQKCQGICPYLPAGSEMRVNGQLVTGTTDPAVELLSRDQLAAHDDTTVIGSADKHTTFSTVVGTLNQTLPHANVPMLSTVLVLAAIANGRIPCVPSTRNADAHCTNANTPSNTVPDYLADSKGKTSISKAISGPRERHGISRTVADAHTTHQQSFDLGQACRNPFDDDCSYSSLFDEDEDLHETIALTNLRPEPLHSAADGSRIAKSPDQSSTPDHDSGAAPSARKNTTEST